MVPGHEFQHKEHMNRQLWLIVELKNNCREKLRVNIVNNCTSLLGAYRHKLPRRQLWDQYIPFPQTAQEQRKVDCHTRF